jgi:hypothetical protein
MPRFRSVLVPARPILLAGCSTWYRSRELVAHMSEIINNIPEIYCPWHTRTHPQTDHLEETLAQWLGKYGWLRNENTRLRLRAARFGELMGLAHPRTPYDEELVLLTRFGTWHFLLEDCLGAGREAYGKDPARQHEYFDALLAGVDAIARHVRSGRQAPPPLASDPVIRALQDIWLILLSLCEQHGVQGLPEQLRMNLELYFEGQREVASYRERRTPPPLDGYIPLCRLTAGMSNMVHLIFLANPCRRWKEVLQLPLITELRDCCTDHMALSNDVFSCDKERASGEVCNLVLVLEHHEALSSQDAVLRAISMVNEAGHRFQRLRVQLFDSLQHDGSLAEDAAVLVNAFEDWMAGAYVWSSRTGRYRREHVDNQSARYARGQAASAP